MDKELTVQLIKMLLETKDTPVTGRTTEQGKLKIAILQRGWVFVGRYYEEGNDCRLENASCVRSWGTIKGLGELAEEGPMEYTKLDPTPTVRFHKLGVVATIDCNESVWKL